MTREELRDWAILGRIVERVEEQKRFCGETLLQKSAYFLKEMFDAPISAPFRIYYYGPFSFDLRETLSTMEGPRRRADRASRMGSDVPRRPPLWSGP